MSSPVTKDQVLFGLCVSMAVLGVVFGWIFTVLPSLQVRMVQVKEQIQETQSDVVQEWSQTKPNQQPVSAIVSDVQHIVEFAQKKSQVSQQLIETLKTRIESEAYASQKTTTKTAQQ